MKENQANGDNFLLKKAKNLLNVSVLTALFIVVVGTTMFLGGNYAYALGIDVTIPTAGTLRYTVNSIAVAPNYGYSGCDEPACTGYQGNLPGTSGTVNRTIIGDGTYKLAISNGAACSGSEVLQGWNGSGSCNTASTTVTISGGQILYVYYNEVLVFDNSTLVTRIISTDPTYDEIVATTTTIGANVYINADQWREGMYLHVNLINNTLSASGGSALDAWEAAFGGIDFELDAGANIVSTTTFFIFPGQVNATWSVKIPNQTPLIGSLLPDQTITSTTTQFVVGYRTALDIVMASTSDALISALITGTTTQSVLRCNPINFDIVVCAISLVYPSQAVLQADFDQIRTNLLEKWPIGYVTRMIDILTASTSAYIPLIDVTIPAGVVGSGSHIRLDANNALDYILNATTSAFANVSASSTETFYEITSYYWDIFVYILLGLYILRRILGAHLIPQFNHKKT
jgi:hypothetical protein